MTNDEAIKTLSNDGCYECSYGCESPAKCPNGGCDVREAVMLAISALERDRWISVEERVPERRKNVLCCGARGGMFVGWFTKISAISDGKTIAYVHGGDGRYVTHWRPLPEPPKEET